MSRSTLLFLRKSERLIISFLSFFAMGILLPYIPLWYSSLSFTSLQFGYIIAFFGLVKTVLTPIVSWYFARFKSIHDTFIVMSLALIITSLLLVSFSYNTPLLILATFLLAAATAPLMPITEFHVYNKNEAGCNLSYGFLRMMGTLSFSISTLLIGYLLVDRNKDWVIYFIILIFILILIISLLFRWIFHISSRVLPKNINSEEQVFESNPEDATIVAIDEKIAEEPLESNSHKFFAVLIKLLNKKHFLPCSAFVLISGSHAVYYVFSIVHWSSLGYSSLLSGLMWGIGAASEAVLFIFSTRIIKRYSFMFITILGGLGASLRWLGMAFDPSLEILSALQVLHAFSFAMVNFGMMVFVSETFPKKDSAVVISVLFAFIGALITVISVVTGYIYESFGGGIYFLSFLTSLAGVFMCFLSLPYLKKNKNIQ